MSRNFNGTTGWLNVGNTTPLNIFGLGVAVTVAAWIKPSRVNVVQVIAARWDTGKLQYLLYIDASAKLNALVSNNGGSNGTATSTAAIGNGVWTHVALTHDNSTVKAFINGAQDGSGSASFTRSSTTGTFEIGANDGGTNLFGGQIAEVGVWGGDRILGYADIGELAALAKGVTPAMVRRGTLKGYWPIWGNASPEADLSGNVGNATLTGTANAADHAPVGRIAATAAAA